MTPPLPLGSSIATENQENIRSIRDHDDDDETGPNFVDHFSLRHPSSTVRFRGSRVHVYESANEQILLEDRRSHKDSKGDHDGNDDEDDDNNGKSRSRQQHRHTVTVKRMDSTSFGLRTLRLAYTLISLLIFGYTFALCFQIILFLFLNLPVDAGLTTGSPDQELNKVISTLLSVPVFLFGLSSLMAIGTTFVADSWSGGYLVRAVFTLPVVISEIIYFTFFLLMPALTFIIALCLQLENPWEVCCYVWIATTAFTFCCFGLAIVWTEVSTCFLLLSIHYNDNDEDTNVLLQIQRSILIMQTQKYSGKKEEEYLVSGEDIAPNGGYTFSEVHQPMQVKRSLYTRLTQMKCLQFMWEPLDPVKRIYSIEEVRDVLPFVTNHNWSLERMFCSGIRSRQVISAKGPSALSTDQVMASLICNIIGTIFIILFFISISFFFLFLWPLSTLFLVGNNPVGGVFLIVSIFSFLRKYFDAAAILCELGLPFFKKYSSLKGRDKTLVLKSRLADVVGNISRSGSVVRWMYLFSFLVLLTFVMFLGAISQDDGLGDRPPIVLVDDYYYPGENTLQYPTCSMSKGFQLSVDGENFNSALADYAFLSAMAYEVPSVTGYLLPQWFGARGIAVDEDEFVKQYREESGTDGNPTYFKLFTFPSVPETAVVAIRGSQTSWDWMVNMQLWSASGLAQIVKWLTPYGWLWTPVLDDLVYFVSIIQSDSLKKVSYYTVTTDFVNSISDTYDSLRVTGASLGGGIAIITAAQTGVSAVAISGLGAELSRNTLDPPVSIQDINERVFNFIPDRDYIGRIGGRPRQHQEAQCNASVSNLFGCHSMWRSVCEINYRCGSNGSPVICRCVLNFDYPEPLPIGNTTRSFKEACQEQEQAFLNGTGLNVTSGWW
ncbi:hypothetical protein FRACYDRAFT_212694 [Fragilariopsis cylindrus CCMP1102]|uniref:Uncharacterized protein n=1 Tax=Fragilariopsis cylindrus CCMP1102 TaxID=635003 RepID=A0A1E7ER82_9STRA|nr:hypothetical protein FRACYDRAFT_212694 [Fragilariopsis cylindrus CCMP1102]|eukprot:OEU08431.1 hypothetical protein FRACYDRAFT_212694 [Fragilariopsis cylindrus CCMP1102]